MSALSRRNLAKISITTAISALVLSACAGAPESETSSAGADSEVFPISIENCGVTVTLDQQPTRAVAIHQGMIEQVLALGLEDQIIGTAGIDDEIQAQWQDAYNAIDVISDSAPAREVLLDREPDLALASYRSAFEASASGTREELAAQGIQTYIDPFSCADEADRPEVTFDSVWNNLDEIGTLFGAPDAAQDVIQDQRERLETVQEEKAGEGFTVVWWDSETEAPYVGAGSGGPALIMNAIGADNVFADIQGKNWENVSWEPIIAANPDVIVLADAEWSTAQEKIDFIKADPVLRELKAVQEDKFVTIQFSESTPGVTVIDGAESATEQFKALS